ncbi:hypothetical protein ES703_75839 [subsurface metagenome]
MDDNKKTGYKELGITDFSSPTEFFLFESGLEIKQGEDMGDYIQRTPAYLPSHREELDFEKSYDIKTSEGQLFKGCKVYRNAYGRQGRGMGFFKTSSGLEVRLKSGLLIRVNGEATKKLQEEKEREKEKEGKGLQKFIGRIEKGLEKVDNAFEKSALRGIKKMLDKDEKYYASKNI